MVDAVRAGEKDPESITIDNRILGNVNYERAENEKASIVFRRSLFVVEDMNAGDVFTEQNVRVIRPGNGMAPKYFHDVLGKTAKTSIKRGTPLSENHLS
jgi:sialic acid synthase SpsE